MAPEVIKGDYTHKCDIWSLAVVLFVLTTGRQPFDGPERDYVFACIKAGAYTLDDTMSEELKSLLSQMLTVQPEDRPTAQECKTHVWFKKLLTDEKQTHDDSVISTEVL